MILYLDASALVKCHICEAGSAEVIDLRAKAEVVGTASISRAEVSAVLAKAVRMRVLSRANAEAALQAFRKGWPDLVRLQLSEAVLALAEAAAWEHGLRGYDAVHLAAAVFWQDMTGEPVTMATFDRELWQSAQRAGLILHPQVLE